MRDRKELKECISLIKDRLKEPGMSDPKNSSVKAGYEKSIEILKHGNRISENNSITCNSYVGYRLRER